MYQAYFLTERKSKVWHTAKAQRLPELANMIVKGSEIMHLAKVDRPHEAGEVTEGDGYERISA